MSRCSVGFWSAFVFGWRLISTHYSIVAGLFWLPRRVLCHVLPMIRNCVIPRASGRCSLLYVMVLFVNEIHHMNMTKSVLFLAYASGVLTRVVFFHSTFEFDAYAFCASLCSWRNCRRPRHSVLSANICALTAFPYLAFPLWTLNWKTSCIMRKNVGNLYFGVCALRLLQQCEHGCVICGFTLLDSSFQSIVCVPRESLEIFWPCKVYAENSTHLRGTYGQNVRVLKPKVLFR